MYYYFNLLTDPGLRKIQADRIDGKWLVKPVKSEVKNICTKIGIDASNLSIFDGIIQWGRTLSFPENELSTSELKK